MYTAKGAEGKVRGRGHLPSRYHEPLPELFDRHVRPALHSGVRVLDVGSGRRPAIPPELRPSGCTYVGLDLSMDELLNAGPGSYDDMIASDVVEYIPELHGRFDLVVSWQVLEHVRSLEGALANIRRYLVPGGTFVAHLSGRHSAFAVVNRLIPHRVGVWAIERLLGRDPRSVFPAPYDRCSFGDLARLMSSWSEVAITPRYIGADYFQFLRPLQRVYLAYENWTIRRRRHDLATHYLISARK